MSQRPSRALDNAVDAFCNSMLSSLKIRISSSGWNDRKKNAKDAGRKCLEYPQYNSETKIKIIKGPLLDFLSACAEYRQAPFQYMCWLSKVFEINQGASETFEAYNTRRKHLKTFFESLLGCTDFLIATVKGAEKNENIQTARIIFKLLHIAIDDETVDETVVELNRKNRTIIKIAKAASVFCENLASRLGVKWSLQESKRDPDFLSPNVYDCLARLTREVTSCLERQFKIEKPTNKREILILMLLLASGELDATWQNDKSRTEFQKSCIEVFGIIPQDEVVTPDYALMMHNLVVFMDAIKYNLGNCMHWFFGQNTKLFKTQILVSIMDLLEWLIFIANHNHVALQHFSLIPTVEAQSILGDIVSQNVFLDLEIYLIHNRLMAQTRPRIANFGYGLDFRKKCLNVIKILSHLFFDEIIKNLPDYISKTERESGAVSFMFYSVRVILHLIQQKMSGDFGLSDLHNAMADDILRVFGGMRESCRCLYEIVITTGIYKDRDKTRCEVIRLAKEFTYELLFKAVTGEIRQATTGEIHPELEILKTKHTKIYEHIFCNPDAKFILDNFVTSFNFQIQSEVLSLFELPLTKLEAIALARIFCAADSLSVESQIFMFPEKRTTVLGELQKLCDASRKKSILVQHFEHMRSIVFEQTLDASVIMSALECLIEADTKKDFVLIAKPLRTIFIILPRLFAYYYQALRTTSMTVIFEHHDTKHGYPTLNTMISLFLFFLFNAQSYISRCKELMQDLDQQQIFRILSIYESLLDPSIEQIMLSVEEQKAVLLSLRHELKSPNISTIETDACEVALRITNPMYCLHIIYQRVPACNPLTLSPASIRYFISDMLGNSYISLPDFNSRIHTAIMSAKLRFLFLAVPNIYAYMRQHSRNVGRFESVENIEKENFEKQNGDYPSLQVLIRVLFETSLILEMMIPEIKIVDENQDAVIKFHTWIFGEVPISDMQQLCRILKWVSDRLLFEINEIESKYRSTVAVEIVSEMKRKIKDRVDKWCEIIQAIPMVRGLGFDDPMDIIALSVNDPMDDISVIDMAFFMIYGNPARSHKSGQRLCNPDLLQYEILSGNVLARKDQPLIAHIDNALKSMLEITEIKVETISKPDSAPPSDYSPDYMITDCVRFIAIFSGLMGDIIIRGLDYDNLSPISEKFLFDEYSDYTANSKDIILRFVERTLCVSQKFIELYVTQLASNLGIEVHKRELNKSELVQGESRWKMSIVGKRRLQELDELTQQMIILKPAQGQNLEQQLQILEKRIPENMRKLLATPSYTASVSTVANATFRSYINLSNYPLIFLIRLKNLFRSIMAHAISIAKILMNFSSLVPGHILQLDFPNPIYIKFIVNGSDEAGLLSQYGSNMPVNSIVFYNKFGCVALKCYRGFITITSEALNPSLLALYEILNENLYTKNDRELLQILVDTGYVNPDSIPEKLSAITYGSVERLPDENPGRQPEIG